MPAHLQSLADAVHDDGFVAIVRPGDFIGPNLICAREQGVGGLRGSFWVIMADSQWYVCNWIHRYWQLPVSQRIELFCCEYLRQIGGFNTKPVPTALRAKYCLKEVGEDELFRQFVDVWIPEALRSVCMSQAVYFRHRGEYCDSVTDLILESMRLELKDAWSGRPVYGSVVNPPGGYSIQVETCVGGWRAFASSPDSGVTYCIDQSGELVVERD